MARKKKAKGTALVLYRPPVPATIPRPEDLGAPGSQASEGADIVAEWGRDLLRTIEEIAPDCRLPPDERKAGRWRPARED